METVIGLGQAGCNIADAFSKYGVYDIYKVDTNLLHDSHSYNLPVYNTHEEYEKKAPNLKMFFSTVDTDILLVVSGAGKVSGVILKVFEQLVGQLGPSRVNVLYIKPDIEELSGEFKLQERLVYNVLQQYARSGMFNNLILVSNPELGKIIGEVPIRSYYEKLNETIVSTIHMINVFEHSEAEIKTNLRKSETSRISTLGIYNSEEEEEKLFFPLDNQLEMHYYYAINEQTLESDGGLMPSIKKKMREINNSSQRGTYGVYSTQYSTNYAYLISFSQKIQKDA